MPTITTQSYFVRERRAPFGSSAVGIPSAATTERTARIQSFFDKYEPEFLKLILGDDLYLEYLEGRTVDGDKWKTFDAYVVNSELKESCIADYVFCKYWADADTEAGDGTVRVNGDNANRVSPLVRIVPVWKQMVESVVKVVNFLAENHDVYCTEHEYNIDGWMKFIWVDERGVANPKYWSMI